MKRIIKLVFKNKVFLYLSSRYITYALQFITTMVIAVVLGPEQFGIWSFLLVLIGFFNIVDLGLPNSLSVLLVQDNNNDAKRKMHITSASLLMAFLSGIVVLLYIITRIIDIPLLEKYQANNYLPAILVVVIFTYFNKLYSNVYRVSNKLLEVAMYQSAIPIILFVVVVVCEKNDINYLIVSYILGATISLLIFFLRKEIKIAKNVIMEDVNVVATKSFWLFLYNSAFYFITYSTSLIVSMYYSIEDYGKYSFAYTISNAVVLLIDAFSFVIFPKMIDKLKNTGSYCKQTLSDIRNNYTTIVHLLIYCALPFFFILCNIFEEYSGASRALCLSALALIPYSNAFGLNTYLIANNYEKILSRVSCGSLIFNILLLVILVKFVHIPFDIVYFVIMLTFTIYSVSCARLVNKELQTLKFSVLKDIRFTFPIKQTVPFLIAVLCVLYSFGTYNYIIAFLPACLFAVMNMKEIKNVIKTIKNILYTPSIVDLRKNE